MGTLEIFSMASKIIEYIEQLEKFMYLCRADCVEGHTPTNEYSDTEIFEAAENFIKGFSGRNGASLSISAQAKRNLRRTVTILKQTYGKIYKLIFYILVSILFYIYFLC